jgi:hypothetical protein
VIWQLGLRGRGDRAVWKDDPNVPATDAARGGLISKAIARQHEIVAEVMGRDDFPTTTTLWAEGSDLHKAGHLVFPVDTIVIFADTSRASTNNGKFNLFAHQWDQDFRTVPRRSGAAYGIYYHVAVWGAGPHLVQGVPLAKIHTCFQQAVDKGDTAYAITNVTNIREVVLGVRAVSELGWDPAGFDAEQFLATWCRQQFPGIEAQAAAIYRAIDHAHVGIPSPELEHPALFHDGVVRAGGFGLLHMLYDMLGVEREDDLARSGSGHPAHVSVALPSRQDMRRDMIEADRVYRQLALEGLPRWKDVYNKIKETEDDVSRSRSSFFEHHFRTQTEIMIGLLEWVLALSDALEVVENTEDSSEFFGHLENATAALGRLLASREATETGKWINWYRGERKMDLSVAHKYTKHLLQQAQDRH